MPIPTEPIGSIPRTPELIQALTVTDCDDPSLGPLYEQAVRDTVARFEAVGSPVVTDGEQRKYHNFWTYPVHGLANTAPDGFVIPFAAGHTRRMLRLTAEMWVPGRAWLQFEVAPDGDGSVIRQTAVFDPAGLLGRAYWYAVSPFHRFVFRGMVRGIAREATARRTATSPEEIHA